MPSFFIIFILFIYGIINFNLIAVIFSIIYYIFEMLINYGGFTIVYKSKLAKYLLPKNYHTITIGSFIFTKGKSLTDEQLRHEKIHTNQYWKYGTLIFLLIYIINFIINLIIYRNIKEAYRNIIFEKEARKYGIL